MLAERRAGPLHRAGRVGELRRDALHPHGAEHRVGDTDDRLASVEMRVGQHVGRAVDVPVGDAVLVEPFDQRRRVQRGGPRGDPVVELLLVVAPGGVGGVALVGRQLGLAHGLGEAAEHTVLVGADQHHLAFSGGVDVGRRDHRQDRARAFAHVIADVVFGDQALHHREYRFVDRAVDHLPAAGALPVVIAITAPSAAKVAARVSPMEMPVRLGGVAGSPTT